ncbi:MAG: NADPH:quinone oxidoreductase [Rhodospirillaceae bacterium]|nr:NADPH:quinone oxidoreductase [Rhodospirillaceae bacterium]
MRAVILREFGDIEDLEFGTLPDPVIKANDVLIKVDAASVNFVDLLVIGGKYQFLPDRPFAPGKLANGTIVDVGPGVSNLKLGDRVQTMEESGGFATLLKAKASQCIPLPDALSAVDAASMSLVFDTAWFALRERGRIQPGETVLVLGATGAVGFAAIQLAKTMGAKVIAGVSSPAKFKLALAGGADGVVDLSAEDLRNSLRSQVYDQTDGHGADIILDMLGDEIFDAAIRAVAWKGRMVVIGFAAGRIPTLKVNYVLLKNMEVSGLQVSDYRKRDMPQMLACFKEVYDLRAAGKISPSATETFALEEYQKALSRIRDRTATGRVVLMPQE